LVVVEQAMQAWVGPTSLVVEQAMQAWVGQINLEAV
jgi:hypothetical protein